MALGRTIPDALRAIVLWYADAMSFAVTFVPVGPGMRGYRTTLSSRMSYMAYIRAVKSATACTYCMHCVTSKRGSAASFGRP